MAVPPPLATEGGFYGWGWNLLIEQAFQKKTGPIHKRNIPVEGISWQVRTPRPLAPF